MQFHFFCIKRNQASHIQESSEWVQVPTRHMPCSRMDSCAVLNSMMVHLSRFFYWNGMNAQACITSLSPCLSFHPYHIPHLLYMYHCVSDFEEFHWMVVSVDQRFGKFLQELSSKLPLLRARSFADSTGIIAKAGLHCRELGSTDSKRHTHIRTRMRSCAAKWLTMTINLLFSLGGAPTAHCSAVLVLIVWCGPSIHPIVRT